MKDCLIVMKPREIPEVRDYLMRLDIPRIYLVGWSEKAIADRGWNYVMAIVRAARFRWAWLASDDIIITQSVLDKLRRRALDSVGTEQVLSGYSQRSHTDWTVNVCPEPLNGDLPRPEAYTFLTMQDMLSGAPLRRSFFTGMSLTGMDTDHWENFPFGCYYDKDTDPGYGSDFHLSKRLQERQVPIHVDREAFCYHWRHEWQHTNDDRDQSPIIGVEQIEVFQT